MLTKDYFAKELIWDYFQEIKPYVKLSVFAREAGIAPGTLSQFMDSKANIRMISLAKLRKMCDIISKKIRYFA